VLGQKPVNVVAGHASWDLRIALADKIADAVAEVAQFPVDLALGPAFRDEPVELGLGSLPDEEVVSSVGHDVELVDVVGRERPGP
jgi:hypothetical protein